MTQPHYHHHNAKNSITMAEEEMTQIMARNLTLFIGCLHTT